MTLHIPIAQVSHSSYHQEELVDPQGLVDLPRDVEVTR
jgi:hypothetical protein